ncbi:helix-turn-helix domain-containing protein [Apilactobacillus ozensis]|uniref:helix-turn-helix domain-containing protein n=1 Tax=Apilactobacillus ozensis TaxID=866801 RepID=UPI00200ACE4F|nr:helix-turn-helix domain-containing protein [Apilactobacillus ozensis]MCK8607047.1 helix-turn-helix domain-containing protein [Apilactobacillus ozensis]
MRFGERLKNERKNKNVSQSEVAKYLHVSRNTISNWENERSYPDIDSLVKISDYYNVSLDTLLKEDIGMKDYLSKKDVIHNIKTFEWLIKVAFVISFFYWMFINPSDLNIFIITMVISCICEFASFLISKWREKIQGDNVFNFALNIGAPLIFISSGIKSLLNAMQTGNFIKTILSIVSILCFVIIFLTAVVLYIRNYLKNKKRC